MLAINRRNTILEIIKKEHSVKVPDLSKKFKVTEETIRRDLEKLENEGHISRTYGGAVLNKSTNADLSVNIRETTNVDGKIKIAKKVVELIENGDTLMIDSSTTSLYVAKLLKDKQNLTVITNSLKISLEMANYDDCEVILTGGTLKSSSLSFIGHWAESAIENYYVNKSIIGCKAIDENIQISEPNEMEAEIKKKMIKCSEMKILVVDSTKFNKKSFVKSFDLHEIDILVTDEKLNSKLEEQISQNKVKVIYS